MASSQTKIVNQVWRVRETAADTTWSDITSHLASIDRVTWALPERFDLSDEALEACETIRKVTARMRRLQQVQRNGYSSDADDGLHQLATRYIPHLLAAVTWPRHTHMNAWLDNIRVSCAAIGAAARQRQEAHRENHN